MSIHQYIPQFDIIWSCSGQCLEHIYNGSCVLFNTLIPLIYLKYFLVLFIIFSYFRLGKQLSKARNNIYGRHLQGGCI